MLLRSLGTGVSGLKNFQTYLDVIGNNISNVSTTGFKKGRINFEDMFNDNVQNASAGRNAIQVGLGSQTGSIDNIVTNGVVNSTGNPYDVAINGEGYFQVSDGPNTFYTRAGDFKLNDAGQLVTSQGYSIDGVTGNFNNLSSFTIASDGTISGVNNDGTPATGLGRLNIYVFNNPAGLEKVGNSLYQESGNSGNANALTGVGTSTKIQQGALEGSNVDLTDEMTALIEAQRAYQANARTITTADQILQELVQLKR
ncbi:flagellar hook-basal body complex protein [Sporolactobacillus laevolacticus]|uniref:flagellar hook-basal body complex protein n=1 Tax=Sporolactobacillus laevolacticus TaxID=33018 RepID=UPI0025B3C693|nr:flagellar hook-basal body complex protein [Sporolactobacillus laevolacticus]MDN3953997.1 flagellar hook-basal body complex protein [Sporolactobacillus laevolacticus]